MASTDNQIVGRGRRYVVVGSLAVGLILMLQNTAAANAVAPFCRERLAHDYAQPFGRMPEVHGPPKSGRLPFAARNVYFEWPTTSIVVPGPVRSDEVSVGFGVPSGSQAKLHLNWLVKVRLLEVDGLGRSRKIVSLQTRRLGTVSPRSLSRTDISFDLGRRPSFYRLEVDFRNLYGNHRLATYGMYFRVLRPRFGARLAVSTRSLHPEEALLFRVENPGTETLYFGEPFSIERLQNSQWQPVRLNLAWHRPLFGLGAGGVSRCQSYDIPAGTAGGTYRVKKNLLGKHRELIAGFEVQT